MRVSLHFAAQQGQAAVAQLLLAARCNIDLQTTGGDTALQAALQELWIPIY